MCALISCQDLSKSYGGRPFFTELSLSLNAGERLAVIGPNGAGKSTFLKVLAMLEDTDDGAVVVSKGVKFAFVQQEDDFKDTDTVHSALFTALHSVHQEDYEKEIKITRVLSEMDFGDPDQSVKKLSGGWRKRLMIAKALIQEPDVLFMDEPTNHLDLEGILWLEKFLTQSALVVVLVSHDRYFLESVSTRVIEINRCFPQGHFTAAGAYSDFLVARQDFLQGQLHQQESLANKVRREVEWLRRGPKARTTKANARINEAHQLIEDLGEAKFRNAQNKKAAIDFTSSDRKTKKLIAVEGVKKSFGNRVLFEDLNLVLTPGMKLGLLGLNGSGKTTLIHILLGKILTDAGKVERVNPLRVVFFDQNREQLDLSLTLRRALAPHGDQVVYRGQPVHVATWARKFLFQTDQLEMTLSSLSGGERARVLMARLIQQPADVLILDEPTNDLDIATLEVLEESLLEFSGALVLVTHDRSLLDRVSTQLLALDGKGGVDFFSDYAQWEFAEREKNRAQESKKNKSVSGLHSASKSKKLSFKDQYEYDQMEARILKAEEELSACQIAMTRPDVVSDAVQLQEVCVRLKTAQDNLEQLYVRWAELETKRE